MNKLFRQNLHRRSIGLPFSVALSQCHSPRLTKTSTQWLQRMMSSTRSTVWSSRINSSNGTCHHPASSGTSHSESLLVRHKKSKSQPITWECHRRANMVRSNTTSSSSKMRQTFENDVGHRVCQLISAARYKVHKFKGSNNQHMYHSKFRRKRRRASIRRCADSKWSHFRRNAKISFLRIFKSRNKKRKDALKRKRKYKSRKTCKKQSRTKSSLRKKKSENVPKKNSSEIRKRPRRVQIRLKDSRKLREESSLNLLVFPR